MNRNNAGNIYYDIEMDVKGLLSSQQQVNTRLDSMERAMRSTGNSVDNLERKTESLGGGFSVLANAVRGFLTVQAAMKLIDIADDMTMLQARITRLSASLDEAKETMASLSAIAANTGSSLASTEKLWETLTASLKEAGATNGQVISLTETLQKIGVVGGSSAEEMSNALRQFGQSISGGIVRAEEFNSVLENMPELARQIATGMGMSLGQLRQAMLAGKLTAEDALNSIQKQAGTVNTEFDKMPVTVDRAKNSLDVAFKNVINDLNQSVGLTSELAGLMQDVANNLNFYNKNIGDSSRMPKLIQLQKEYNDEVKDGQRWYETDTIFQQRRGQAAFELKRVEQEIASIRAKSAKEIEANSTPIKVKSGTSNNPKEDALIKRSQRRIELSKLEGEAREKLQAIYDAEDAGISKNDPRVKSLQEQYAQTYKNNQAQKESNQESKHTVAQSEAVAQKLDQLRQQSDLNAVSSQNLTLEQTKLRAEMSLGKNATAAQREEAAKYAEAIWQQAAALKARNLIPEVAENDDYQSKTAQLELLKGQRDSQGNLIISQQQYQQESEKLAAEHVGNLAKINSQNAVTPQQSLAGQVDPVQQLANENAEKLSLINQYEQAGVLAHGQAAALKQAQDTKYNQDSYDAMWNLWKSQSQINQLMGAGIDTLSSGSASALSGIITGTESAGEAFRNLANGALNAMLEQLIKVGIQAMLVRTVLGSFMGGVSSISSPSVATPSLNTGALGLSSGWQSYVSGARKNGGPVNGSGLYRVGESGKPEIFQASNGSQYMIPGDNGKVISNRNMATSVSAGSSGSLNIDLGGITVNLPSSSNQPASSVDANGIGKQIQQSVVNAINDQVNRQGTPLWRAINGR
ncbi:tape measure protein [Rosenbergiella epipactidis]|uniref:tape measure protein n=1 Tax=Rosenbergiella epipactidis TaxID=1544694 RepID=UPI001F4DC5D2|nr:tape measure protein [Rosenbergiella epipactidis]